MFKKNGYLYSVRDVNKAEIHLLEPRYILFGMDIGGASIAFNEDKEMWQHIKDKNINVNSIRTSLNEARLIKFREQREQYLRLQEVLDKYQTHDFNYRAR